MTAAEKVQAVREASLGAPPWRPAERRTRTRGLRRFRPFDRRARNRSVREQHEADYILSEREHAEAMREEGSRPFVQRTHRPRTHLRADQLAPGDWIEVEGHRLEVGEVHITRSLVLLDFVGLHYGLNLACDRLVRTASA